MSNLENILILKKGGIHIKKKNRGSFTRWCKGKVTEECIRRGKNSPNPAIRKKAVFAANSRRWKHANGGIIKAQEGTTNGFWSKLWNAVKEGGMAARDAKLGAIGAQQVRDLYAEGKNQEAQDLAKQYAKANTTGIALAGGAASTGLLGDLFVTGATTAADTFIDGNTKDFGKNLVKNAAGDLIGHGIFGTLKKINFGDTWAKLQHPTWKKYYHGSPKEFDIKNFYKGTVADSGLHMSDRRDVAEYFAGANWFNAEKPTVYEFYAPKPSMEFMDLHGNGVNMLSGNTKRISGNALGKGTFDGTPYSQLEYKALRENGGEDVIDFLPSYVNDRYGSVVQPFQLKRDVTIPIEKYHWPDRPKHVDDRLKEMRKQYDLATENGDEATRIKLNSEISDIMAENKIPVVKYANNNAFEGGGMSYMLFDRSKLHLINPKHQFDIMRPATTMLGAGLGIGYGVSQLKGE